MTDLTIAGLQRAYRDGSLTPDALIDRLLSRIDAHGDPAIWITRLSRERIEPWLARLRASSPETLPLYGIPFAIKDNIDLAGVPTTAGCPAYAHTPEQSAFAVQLLIDAGAIPLGKTNLDQFATGLVGERSPAVHGTPDNAFDPAFIPGGSSSGSAVAVACGQVSFALGTDTAGSGRVPAGFNNLFGLKPSLGLLSTRGVVPACATLDTISLFALSADDAHTVLDTTARFDPCCAWSRRHDFRAAGQRYGAPPAAFRFGVPPESQWATDPAHTRAMQTAIRTLEALGGTRTEIDCTPMLEAARLLYGGPWVAERYHAIRALIEERPETLHPITRQVIAGGSQPSAVEAFDARYRLAELGRQANEGLAQVDLMLAPTVTTHPTKAEVAAAPIELNTQLGRWTNFMNLLDYAALAVPVSLLEGRPQGVTLFGPAFADLKLLGFGRAMEQHLALPLGATGQPRRQAAPLPPAADGLTDLVVCGAHLSGMPLNHQLTERRARRVAVTRSSAAYRLLALPGEPPRPAMVRDEQHGAAIEVEVWRLPTVALGSLLAEIAPPLGLGRLELASGEWCCGFVTVAGALEAMHDVHDITEWGSWRRWLHTRPATTA
ncbi:allophanate hydrolase [Kushneria sinocarnis]|uniref:Allophanate hydrolase n=1 Tax=Kushneria sinocarnis TaxID=595502 RepID=A0A420X1A3_9GAMM|nr:allophanate hydrolase [Kushneria sinocarnis]RKR07638.1 allophanate hydrolase [Kushneria sinocarnis]